MDPASLILTAEPAVISPAIIFQFVVLILLIVLSAFFSSAETAFSSANRIKMRSLADEGNKTAALVIKILDSYSKLLSAILIGNNTYGKNSIQQVVPMTNGCGLMLTSSKYILPMGEDIDDIGIKPDYYVENSKMMKEAIKIINQVVKKEK